MSSTRRAAASSPFSPERYASSAEFERGLPANLIARRCSVLDNRADRELIWWLHLLSHRGGMSAVCNALLDGFADLDVSEKGGQNALLGHRFPTKPGNLVQKS